MSSDAVHVLIMKVMTDKFCHAEKRDLDSCMQYYVPHHLDGSYVDASIQRRGIKKCEDHQKAYQLCVADDKKQQALVRTVYKMQQCKDERNALVKCQQAAGGKSLSAGGCDPQFYAMMECGLVHMVKNMSGRARQSGNSNGGGGAAADQQLA